MKTKRFDSVLIANRGEIAVRVIRGLKDLGLRSIAVYSEADENSLHRKLADCAVSLEGNTSAETYLDIEKILYAAKISGASAVHPGYGFLSESSAFAEAVRGAGMVFIGPPTAAMNLMGNKIEAKRLMIKNQIPVTPGSDKPLENTAALQILADRIGFPMILKAANGGGGRGMREVRKVADLEEAFLACKREAKAYFGNDDVFAERFIENPRHIEVQVLVDEYGNGFHLNERDCSIQRRHQKLIEEAPSTYLDESRRSELGKMAVKAALAAGYQGVGTIEFICESPDQIYFMEMNTRIQVEHTVSEQICHFDLIHAQIRVALGESLQDLKQADLVPKCWAIECRINAEEPRLDFAPSPGLIKKLHWPQGPNVRIDSHIYEGYIVPTFYDSMIAKIIVWGETRSMAIARMKRALQELRIEGVPTTTRFHEAVLDHPEFISGDFNTGFIDKNWHNLLPVISGETEIKADEFDPLAFLLPVVIHSVQSQSYNLANKIVEAPKTSRWHEKARQESIGY